MKTTLQYRIIFLMVVFSVFFIASFTAIQVKNKMDSISLFNAYRARLGSFIARNVLVPFAVELEKLDNVSAVNAIKKTLAPYVTSEVLEEVSIISEKTYISPEDEKRINEINKMDEKKWISYFIDRKQKKIDIFISFVSGNPYIVKLSYSLGNVYEALKQVYNPVILTVIIVVIANIVFASFLSKIVVSPVQTLHAFTKIVAEGDLDSQVKIETGDELQELGSAFNSMTAELKKMRAKAENANPLTKLPGNIVIMEEVENRIKKREQIAIFYSDLDNFKAFNDKYGIHKGDEAIEMTANVMKEIVSKQGNNNDLVGHEGGDDFVIVTTPEKADAIGQGIIDEFNKRVKNLYDKKDISQGFFISRDRSGQTHKFPIMGISLAGVTNQYRELKSYGEITNICAEIKKKVKEKEGSAYHIDKRKE